VQVAVLVFDHVVISEALGPYEVLHRVPGVEVVLAGLTRGEVRDRRDVLSLNVRTTIDEIERPDVLIVPGGLGEFALLNNERVLDWVRSVHRDTLWTTSVGIGSLLLAKAGILEGIEAATHWAFRDRLAELGAIPSSERVVEHGKIITAAGVSAGIDMALTLAEHLSDPVTARAVQLWIEYDPAPPFDSGTLAKADESVVARATQLLDD
jgi:putative intracellular protease/amidase